MPDDLKEKIIAEIQKTGFPLELRVANQFRSLGYQVTHSLYFVDRDEGKAREVDIRAVKTFQTPSDSQVSFNNVSLVVYAECKKSVDKPWVFFSSSVDDEDAQFWTMPITPAMALKEEDLKNMVTFDPFGGFSLRARTYFEAFKKQDSAEMIFKALTTAVKATLAEAVPHCTFYGSTLTFYFPMVVYEGDLFQARLASSAVQVDEVDAVLASVSYESESYARQTLAVPILKEGGLPTFMNGLALFAHAVLRFLSPRYANADPLPVPAQFLPSPLRSDRVRQEATRIGRMNTCVGPGVANET